MLTNKVALIIGAKGGLGTHVTRAFLDAGAAVTGVSRSISAADFAHPKFTAHAADLTQAAAARDLVAGMQRIDVLVHVMGGFAGGTPVEQTTDETLEQMLTMNLRAAFYITRAVIPVMRAQ
ncbi:MAG TPA: SDR family NAD(P)-dependent oxidoreductase, partial [Candidatus Solibacter sp.]|nr:SDR family NAD(P)-dependent oxidoreductase [Candidatus Solibacter sp.]